ncbi:MAG: phosphate ABC transporter permease subunit PstC [Synechococcales bacterium]|nr:phosphate ABC transporter permease subunit PstC [Synechococcales bacterium]
MAAPASGAKQGRGIELPSGYPERRDRPKIEQITDRGLVGVTLAFAGGVGLLLGAIALLIALRAIPALREFGLGFLVSAIWNPVQNAYGALPMLYGTLVSSLLALLIAVPLGLGTAIFLSEDFLPPPLRTGLVFMVELLAAIPSVVYGLWGIYVLIPLYRPVGQWLYDHWGWFPLFSTPPAGPGMLPAALVLAMMILPLVTAISRDSLAALPPDLRQASLGLGASRWRTIFSVLLPAAASGIGGGVMLALGRAMGETMAVTMLIGNANQLSLSLLAPANTVSSLLANQFAEAKGLQVAALMYAALVLVVMTLVVNGLAELVIQRLKAKY